MPRQNTLLAFSAVCAVLLPLSASIGGAQAVNDSLARELLAAVAAARSQVTRPTPVKHDEPAEAQLSARGEAVRELLRRHSYADSVDATLAREYAQRHSATELRQLGAFFRSPLGVSFIRARAEADDAMGAVTNRILSEHSVEFSTIIRDAFPKVPPP